ncbi:MAG: autotransporter strand-loop-strand O-heptosyltransferase [Selenomonadaceae bacterium]|nr:autotransporter strand-loop-strand O-heptosyltransferase [Selenomonadaceae bacterium]
MRKFYFCARDIRDYLRGVMNTTELDNTPNFEPNFPALTDAPAIQNFLFDVMKIYTYREAGCNSPIVGETGIEGLRLDFNFGLRLDVPEGSFHVRIGDDSGQIFFDRDISDVRLISVEKYFICWKVEVSLDGAKIFEHTLNLNGQKVLLTFDKRCGLGDTLAFLPSIAEFKRKNNCDVEIFLPEYLRELAANLYPEIPQANEINFDGYATYFYKMYGGDFPFCSTDYRKEPLARMANYIVGIETLPAKPIFRPTAQRFCPEPYICIGIQASTPRKGWLYPDGWRIVVNYLKSLGYRVFCIDKEKVQREENYSVIMPDNAEDFTGNFSIMERANMLYHAEFFIGLSSGLSWLADAVNCPVVMICGFSQNWFEFYTPYRVANRLVCNGCFNNVNVVFTHKPCPYHNGTARELECQKKIYPRQVINAIERLILDKNLTPPILRNLT